VNPKLGKRSFDGQGARQKSYNHIGIQNYHSQVVSKRAGEPKIHQTSISKQKSNIETSE